MPTTLVSCTVRVYLSGWEIVRTQLVLLGVRPEQAVPDAPSDSVAYITVTLSMTGECTLSSDDPYYSHKTKYIKVAV